MTSLIRTLSVAVLALTCLEAQATQVHPCADIAEPSARLQCYDEAFPPTSGKPSSTPPIARSTADLERDFGLASRDIEQRKPEAARDSRVDRVEAEVVEVNGIAGGERLLLLDNGQSWRITDGRSRGPLKSGDTVRIRRQLSGSYLLTTPGGVGLRVRRVQ